MRCAATLSALVAAMVAAGCATTAPPPSDRPFDLVGRVAVSFDGRAFSSSVRWEHGASREEAWLLTPLGQTVAHIVSDADGATLTGADRRQYRADSVEALTRQALGWELPLARLTWWIRGEPVPDSTPARAERDGRARLTLLEQGGWRIVYTYRDSGEAGELPRRLDLRSGVQEIRFLIDSWRTAGSP
jgi:outer membrane lipoprotein LolB